MKPGLYPSLIPYNLCHARSHSSQCPTPFLSFDTHEYNLLSLWTIPIEVHWGHLVHEIELHHKSLPDSRNGVVLYFCMSKPILIPSQLHSSTFIKFLSSLMWWSEGNQIQSPRSRVVNMDATRCTVSRLSYSCHDSDSMQCYMAIIVTAIVQVTNLALAYI